ncbi:hypothetical protein JKP88DRAFT_254125 [Tribonema minus]|uniref:Uncharacterized protein n=1 Tax=Tribonema minus TaxID=303371 RepID=A0A835Z959_9STRA|nr:hypothetical protein JKP88DRAFT_254125 [Tribonema minus]
MDYRSRCDHASRQRVRRALPIRSTGTGDADRAVPRNRLVHRPLADGYGRVRAAISAPEIARCLDTSTTGSDGWVTVALASTSDSAQGTFYCDRAPRRLKHFHWLDDQSYRFPVKLLMVGGGVNERDIAAVQCDVAQTTRRTRSSNCPSRGNRS